jgi:mutator protein MutT
MHLISSTHPSKIFKYCPRCGKEGFRFDGTKLFVCDNCQFHYYLNEAAAVCGIIELPDGKIILTRRKHNPAAGKLDLPGGFVDIMERAEDAMTREIHEELGIHVTSLKLLATFPNEYVFKGISYYTCDTAFICSVQDISEMQATDDVTEAVIIHPSQIDYNEISFPSIVNVLKMYIANH